MEPRALGVSSTLAPWSMNEVEDFLRENCKMGVKGDRPRMLPPPLEDRGSLSQIPLKRF